MRIYLRAFELDDYKLINKWRKDEEDYKLIVGNKYYVSSERDKKWVEEKIFKDAKDIYLAICLKENDEMIGYLSLNNIDWRNRKVEWGGITIGEKKHRGKGYANEAAYLMLDFAFSELGIHRFYGHWLEANKASIMLGKKLGFKHEGVLRDSVYKNNNFNNVVVMSILKEEFEIIKDNYKSEVITKE